MELPGHIYPVFAVQEFEPSYVYTYLHLCNFMELPGHMYHVFAGQEFEPSYVYSLCSYA
jgi:hypothetical protein